MSILQAHNEMVIDAPVSRIWSLITDIHQLHKINPGVVKAAGTMDQLNATRTCDVKNGGKIGTTTERLVELVPEKKTTWALEKDSFGMGRMLREARFVFQLESLNTSRTRVVNETYYKPANVLAAILNSIAMKRMMASTQGRILENLRLLAEGR